MSSAIRSEPTDADCQSASLAGLAVTLFLVVVGLHLFDVLRAQASLQDCVLAGRMGCDISGAP